MLGHFRERFTRKIRFEKFIESDQGRCRVAAPAAEPGAVRNFLLQFDQNAAMRFRAVEKKFRRAHHEIVVARWKIDIVTTEIDPAILFFDVDLVVKRNGRDESFDFVKAVVTAIENSQ